MPQTVPDAFEFEQEGDTPGRTLDGAGGSPILAEQVQDVVTDLRTDIQEALSAAALGWRPIASGTESGVSAFVIDVTAGGQYPAGTFRQMRLTLRGSADSAAYVTIRINDNVADSHRRGWTSWRMDTGAVVDSGYGLASNARVANWSTAFGNNCVLTIFNTDVSSQVSWIADASRVSGTASNHFRTLAHGARIDGNALVSSLRVATAAPAVDFTVRWILEGLRVP